MWLRNSVARRQSITGSPNGSIAPGMAEGGIMMLFFQ
jgi:hypothetical protein